MTKAEHSPGAPAFRVPSSLGLVNKESGAPVEPRRTRRSADGIRITVTAPTAATPQQVAARLGWELRGRTAVEPSPEHRLIVPIVLLCAAIMLDTAAAVIAIVAVVGTAGW